MRLAYAGLWTAADREGRFKWKPMQLKNTALPYDDCDFSRVLDALATRGFIFKYEISGVVYGVILSWKVHQFINNKEPQSLIPPPPQDLVDQEVDAIATRRARDFHASSTRGVKEGKGKEQSIRPSKTDDRYTVFVEALAKYWAHKNPDLKFNLSSADGKQLKNFLAAHPNVTIEQFKTCLNHRGKSEVVHSQAFNRWISRTLEFFEGPLDQYWKPKSGPTVVSPPRAPVSNAAADAELERQGIKIAK